jgi:hypothetical protein
MSLSPVTWRTVMKATAMVLMTIKKNFILLCIILSEISVDENHLILIVSPAQISAFSMAFSKLVIS